MINPASYCPPCLGGTVASSCSLSLVFRHIAPAPRRMPSQDFPEHSSALSVKILPVLTAYHSQIPTALLDPVVTTPMQGNSKVTLSYIQTWVTGKTIRALLPAGIE